MKNFKLFLFGIVTGIVMWFAGTGIASATIINISLDSNDWELKPDYVYQSPNHSITTTSEGLQVINNQANGGSPWGVDIRTVDSFNMQNAVVRYKWKAVDNNGGFSYAGYWNGFENWVFGSQMTTAWSWAGSYVIPFDTWIYTEARVADDLSLYYNFSTTGYSNSGGFRHYSGTTSQAFYDSLTDIHMLAAIVDNYSAGAGFVINEMYLDVPEVPGVPEPGTLMLMLLSIMGLIYNRNFHTS